MISTESTISSLEVLEVLKEAVVCSDDDDDDDAVVVVVVDDDDDDDDVDRALSTVQSQYARSDFTDTVLRIAVLNLSRKPAVDPTALINPLESWKVLIIFKMTLMFSTTRFGSSAWVKSSEQPFVTTAAAIAEEEEEEEEDEEEEDVE